MIIFPGYAISTVDEDRPVAPSAYINAAVDLDNASNAVGDFAIWLLVILFVGNVSSRQLFIVTIIPRRKKVMALFIYWVFIILKY